MVGVVGHTEWVDFAVCPRLPVPGEILEGREAFSVAAGGGAVAAVQLARLAGAGDAFFLTALGDDAAGSWARADLEQRGLVLEAATVGAPQRRAFTFLTDDHERTITVLGDRLVPAPSRDAALDWSRCGGADAIYFTGGDAAALRAARGARVLVATPRARDAIRIAGVELDVLVGSKHDTGEALEDFEPAPRHIVLTEGDRGGRWSGRDGTTGDWVAADVPGPAVDAYGCGDSFAAGLTFGLGSGLTLPDALALAARCGAHCLTGRGPYAAQLADAAPPP